MGTARTRPEPADLSRTSGWRAFVSGASAAARNPPSRTASWSWRS